MIPDPLHAVVFDMDGLLLDTEVVYRDVFTAVCREHGYHVPDTAYRSLIGAPEERVNDLLRDAFGPDFPLERIDDDCTLGLEAAWRRGVPAKAGAHALLDLLREHSIPCAVATSTARPRALQHLEAAGLLDRIDALVARGDVTNGKPHPESYLAAAARLDAAPARCLALEDSHNGVRAAHAAGMATVMVPDLLEPTEEIAALCVAVVESLHDVHAHITARMRGAAG